MKKLFSFILMIFLCFFNLTAAPPKSVQAAATEYACILTSDTYFYPSENAAKGLFTLPKTYYVKVLSKGTLYTKVEYQTDSVATQALVGYCLTSQLTFVEYIPVNPYLYATFDVIYTAENAGSSDELLEKLTFTCTYYGDYEVGSKTYAYVLREGEYVYVPKPQDFAYPQNPEHEEWLSSQQPDSPLETNATPIQVGLLVVLCLLVPLLSAVIVKSSKSPTYDLEE